MQNDSRITFHPFAEGAALHQEGSHRLWVLNHSSAVLWCLFEENGEGEELISAYAGHFGISVEQAEADIQKVLGAFERDGLIDSGARGAEKRSLRLEAGGRRLVDQPSDPCPSQSSPFTHLRTKISSWEQTYRVAGVSWRIACSDSAAEEKWFASFKHLKSNSAAADLHYHITREDSGWSLTGAGERVAELADDQVLPWLLTLLFGELCHRQPQHLLLHAAVARREGQLLLLPGESTFGKSTLAAALAANGWTLYSDELAPLDPATLTVAPFPLPVGVKRRSLPALQTFYPKLAETPAHRRADGQVVRYLAPPQIALASPATPPASVAALVFPRYRPDAATRLEQLPPLAALERLAQTGSSERPLTNHDVQALLTLAGQRPCWSLDYSDLGEAVKTITTVARGVKNLQS